MAQGAAEAAAVAAGVGRVKLGGSEGGDGRAEGRRRGRVPEALADSAAREFERRTLRFNDTRRTVWVAFTKDDYATAKSALVTRWRLTRGRPNVVSERSRPRPIRSVTCPTTSASTTR